MYGAASGDDLLDENATLRPLTPYAESKVRAEEALHELADSGFSPIFMRNSTAYGVSPRLRLDVVLNNLAAWAHTTGRIRLLSDGSAWRPLVHVQDISRATLAFLEAPRETVHDQAVNIGSADQNVRIRDLAETLHESARLRGRVERRRNPGPPQLSRRLLEARECASGFRCEWTVKRGADELVSAYQRVGLTFDEFESIGRYTRLAQLKRLLDEHALDDDLRWRVPRPVS